MSEKNSFIKKLFLLIPGFKERYESDLALNERIKIALEEKEQRQNFLKNMDYIISNPDNYLYHNINDYQTILYKNAFDIHKIYSAPKSIYGVDFEYFNYFKSLCEDSYQIVSMNTSRIDIFYNILNRFDKNLFEHNFRLPGFCSLYEQQIYRLKRSEIVESYLNRSYKSALSHSYGLQRVKNKIDNMENWFFCASHFENYFTINEKMIIEQLHNDYINNHKPLFEKRST